MIQLAKVNRKNAFIRFKANKFDMEYSLLPANEEYRMVENKEIDVVLIEHKDRLSRFCFNYLLSYFNSYGVRIEKVEEVMSKSFENELVEDILSLMTSFSAKIYGRRSSQNRKKKEKGESE